MSRQTMLYPLELNLLLDNENTQRNFCAEGFDLLQNSLAAWVEAHGTQADRKAWRLFQDLLCSVWDCDRSEAMCARRGDFHKEAHGLAREGLMGLFVLAYCVWRGWGCDKDVEKAQDLFGMAFTRGFTPALPCLVESLYGFRPEFDDEYARLVNEALDSGDELCLLVIARLLLFGLDLSERRFTDVQNRLWASARKGGMDALRMLLLLGSNLAQYDGPLLHHEKALALLQRHADSGDAWAHVFLYQCYLGEIPGLVPCDTQKGHEHMRAADRLHDAYTAILLCLEAAAQGEKSDAIRNLEAMKDSPTPRALSLLGGILFNSGLEDNQEQAFISLRKGFLRRNYSSCAVLYTDYLLQRLRRLALDGKERAKNSPQGAEPVLLRAELLRVADMGIASAQFAAAKVLLTGAFATGADPVPGARYLEKAVRAGHDGAIVFAAWTRSLWPAFKLDHDELLGHLTAGADWLKPNSLAAAFIPMYPVRIWLAPDLDPDTTQMMDMSLDSLRHVAGQRHVPLAEAFLLVRDTRFLARDLAGRPQVADGDAVGTIIARCQTVLGHARVYADIEALFELLRLLPALRSSCTPKELVLAGSILAQGMAQGAPEGGSLDDVEEALYSLLQEFGIARGVAARALTHLDDALPA